MHFLYAAFLVIKLLIAQFQFLYYHNVAVLCENQIKKGGTELTLQYRYNK